jgi:hypothetical protein
MTVDIARNGGDIRATLSLYGYCEGDPITATDPSGHYAHLFVPDVGEQTTYFLRVLKVNAGRVISQKKNYTQIIYDARGMRQPFVKKEFYFWFYNAVKSGGAWDLKRCVPWEWRFRPKYRFKSKNISLDEFGNLHYGYVGRAAGFSLMTLYAGSCYAAAKSKTTKAEREDRKLIKWGYNLYKSNGAIQRKPSQIDRYIYDGYTTARGY